MSTTEEFLNTLKAKGYKFDGDEQFLNYIKALQQADNLSGKLKGTYFNVMLARYVRTVSPDETVDAKLEVLDALAEAMKNLVEQALGTDKMAAQERNAALVFHRTAKSTIASAIKAGHPLDDINVGKSALAKETRGMAKLLSPLEVCEHHLIKVSKQYEFLSADERRKVIKMIQGLESQYANGQ